MKGWVSNDHARKISKVHRLVILHVCKVTRGSIKSNRKVAHVCVYADLFMIVFDCLDIIPQLVPHRLRADLSLGSHVFGGKAVVHPMHVINSPEEQSPPCRRGHPVRGQKGLDIVPIKVAQEVVARARYSHRTAHLLSIGTIAKLYISVLEHCIV